MSTLIELYQKSLNDNINAQFNKLGIRYRYSIVPQGDLCKLVRHRPGSPTEPYTDPVTIYSGNAPICASTAYMNAYWDLIEELERRQTAHSPSDGIRPEVEEEVRDLLRFTGSYA